MSKPFFSIITCTYNSSAYVERNIASVARQTYKNYEHIFVDGNSTDTTQQKIKNYMQQDAAHVALHTASPQGISHAMNYGIQKANGTYIIHLHSDDSLADENVLADVYEFLQANNEPDWIYGRINIIKNTEVISTFPQHTLWMVRRARSFKKYLLTFINFIPHQAVFIKKEVFATFGDFNQKLKCNMDLDMWLRIRKSTSWLFFNRIISNYALREDAQSSGPRNKAANDKERDEVMRSHLNFAQFIVFKCSTGMLTIYNACKKK